MPGLVGFIDASVDRAYGRQILRKMQDLVTCDDFYVKDPLFCDRSIYAARSHPDIVQRPPQPFHRDGVYIWLDGEFYNRDELIKRHPAAENTDPGILYALLKDRCDFSALREIDGFFSAVIYDSVGQKLHLASDRYGLRHLYWTVHRNGLAWASEVKSMLALPGFEPRIDRRAADEFFGIGYLLENRTWFEGVELLASGSVLTWDIREKSLERRRYWWWNEIRPFDGRVDENELSEELGRLFVDAVGRRCREDEPVGVSLSGGLDSRALLAAMPKREAPIHALTFGKAGCDDIRLAAMAAKVRGAVHHVVEIHGENWLEPRLEGVWRTDGQLDLMHMHGIESMEAIRDAFRINLHGFLGGAVLGGRYMVDRQVFKSSDPEKLAAEYMGCHPDLLENREAYSSLGREEFYFIQNRGRRFVLGGLRMYLTATEQRLPFFDNRLIEFTYSLPDVLRSRSRLYKAMLLRCFPEYFRRIPWQDTGLPIGWPDPAVRAVVLARRIRDGFVRRMHRLGFPVRPGGRTYVDYSTWLRQEPARSFLSETFDTPKAIYPEYLSKKQVKQDWERHLRGEDRAKAVCRYLTFEVWLQQVFEGRFRPGFSVEPRVGRRV